MSEYTPTTEQVRATYLGGTLIECREEGFGRFHRWLAEVERAAAERAIRSFAEHLLTHEMPEHGIHVNMTPYREGLVDGVNRAVIAASRFSRTEEQ